MLSRIFNELFRRRVPHFLGAYLAAGWAGLEFLDFLVNRYLLSPYLTDFVLATWALMIPTLLLLAWFHGAPGRDRWTLAEKIGIPVNLVVSAAVLYLIFVGKDLGAATTSVTVENEVGETMQREVPKSQFRKRLAIYFFDNETPDTAIDWLQYAMAWGLQDDLSQDIFLDVRSAEGVANLEAGISDRLKQAGYVDGTGVPLTLKRQIAEDLHLDHFVAGSLRQNSDTIVADLQLYDTRSGKPVAEHSIRAATVFELIDRASVALRRDLGIPDSHIDDTPDLPLAEIHTASLPAFRAAMAGLHAMIMQEDWDASGEQLRRAVREDSTYAFAHFYNYASSLLRNDMAAAREAIERTITYSYKLPERVQFMARASYYRFVRQDIDKSIAVAEMYAELYPDDLTAHQLKAVLYSDNGERDKAISEYERTLELDPTFYDALRRIGELYQAEGDLERARSYFEAYAEQFPDDARSFTTLGSLSRLQGDHEAARDYFERAALIDSGDPQLIINLAWAQYNLGSFDDAKRQIDDAADIAETTQERIAVFDAYRSYYQRRGQIRQAVDYMHRKWAESDAANPPLLAAQTKLLDLDVYADAGRVDAAFDTLAAIEARMEPPLDLVTALGHMQIATAIDDPDELARASAGIGRFIDGLGIESLRWMQIGGEGRVLALRGDCEQALISYQRSLELEPNRVAIHLDIAECHRTTGDLATAETSLRRALNLSPYSGRAHTELAKLYLEMGEPDPARDHLETALRIWADPDPAFQPAAEARELLASLSPE